MVERAVTTVLATAETLVLTLAVRVGEAAKSERFVWRAALL